MLPFTKDELSSIWHRLADGSECDQDGRVGVGEGVDAHIACTCDPRNRGPQRDLLRRGRVADDNLWTLDAVVTRHVLSMIEACNGNKSQAASRLRINRATIYRIINRMHPTVTSVATVEPSPIVPTKEASW
jgi:transcriptional regulator of acetoin/glycerol metabolism